MPTRSCSSSLASRAASPNTSVTGLVIGRWRLASRTSSSPGRSPFPRPALCSTRRRSASTSTPRSPRMTVARHSWSRSRASSRCSVPIRSCPSRPASPRAWSTACWAHSVTRIGDTSPVVSPQHIPARDGTLPKGQFVARRATESAACSPRASTTAPVCSAGTSERRIAVHFCPVFWVSSRTASPITVGWPRRRLAVAADPVKAMVSCPVRWSSRSPRSAPATPAPRPAARAPPCRPRPPPVLDTRPTGSPVDASSTVAPSSVAVCQASRT